MMEHGNRMRWDWIGNRCTIHVHSAFCVSLALTPIGSIAEKVAALKYSDRFPNCSFVYLMCTGFMSTFVAATAFTSQGME
jgi:uncharacterized membrane protein